MTYINTHKRHNKAEKCFQKKLNLKKVIKTIHYTIGVQKEIDSIISNLRELNGNFINPTLKSA